MWWRSYQLVFLGTLSNQIIVLVHCSVLKEVRQAFLVLFQLSQNTCCLCILLFCLDKLLLLNISQSVSYDRPVKYSLRMAPEFSLLHSIPYLTFGFSSSPLPKQCEISHCLRTRKSIVFLKVGSVYQKKEWVK